MRPSNYFWSVNGLNQTTSGLGVVCWLKFLSGCAKLQVAHSEPLVGVHMLQEILRASGYKYAIADLGLDTTAVNHGATELVTDLDRTCGLSNSKWAQ